MKEHVRAILRAYPEILFLDGSAPGVVLLAVTLIHPNVAAAGIIAVLAAHAFARFVGMAGPSLAAGHYTYNPLLVGMSLGYVFRLTPATVLLVVAAGVFAFILTAVMADALVTRLRLPVLTLPFAVTRSVAYLAMSRYGHLAAIAPGRGALFAADLSVPAWAAGFFRSFGTILFSPSVAVGVVFCLLVLYRSRILFLLAVMGYYVGAATRALLLGSADQAFGDLNSFNFILIAIAVGGVFLVPSLGSYLLAAAAVVVGTIVLDGLVAVGSRHALPPFTLPFCLVSLAVIHVLRVVRCPMLATNLGRTPEETLETHLTNQLRYRGDRRTLFLPFSGRWTVWQGFDGRWTHKGIWRDAYDFVIADSDGNTYRGDGSRLEDHDCFRKPVLSPVSARVVRVVSHLADSPVGSVDNTNNWGNLIVLDDPRGFFVELSHLAAHSVRVKQGDWVERGTVLGLCGNSGYAPQPHIHVQVQVSAAAGAATLPFSFVSYTDGTQHHANDLPSEGHEVEPLYPDKRLDAATSFILDDEVHYEVLRNGRPHGRLSVHVGMADDGTYYLQSDRGRLYFGKHEGTFYCYRVEGHDPWLGRLFLALPRMPLAYRRGLAWDDYVPVGLATTGVRRALARLLSSFLPGLAKVRVHMRFASETRVESHIESSALGLHQIAAVELDGAGRRAAIRSGDFLLREATREDG